MAWFSRKSAPKAAPSASPSSAGAHLASSDARILELGGEMLQRARGHKAGLFSRQFYSDALMDWSMKDQNFKVQLFRFVDAFPVLHETDDIYDHLRDYLSQPGVTVPTVINAAIKAGGLMKGVAVGQISKQIKSMAAKFIAGEDAASALPSLRAMWDQGIAFSVDLLGEACVSDAEADHYQRKYLDLIANLPAQVASWPASTRLESDHLGPVPRVNVSVKSSALSARCDPIDTPGAMRDLLKRLLPILEAARDRGVFVNFDMEQFALKDFTLALFQKCCETIEFHAGLAMQAYLRSGEDDARAMVNWARAKNKLVTVRLVKGAYWDYEVINAEQRGWPCPVWPTKRETDACFERMTDIFLDASPHSRTRGTGVPPVSSGGSSGTGVPPVSSPGPGIKLALGSHNVRSIAYALAALERRGLPRSAIELQMLHGMADQLKHAAAEMDLRVREYVPVGQMIPGMAYLVRRLLENTSNESWLKAGFLDNVDTTQLLASPHAGSGGAGVPPASSSNGQHSHDASSASPPSPAASSPSSSAFSSPTGAERIPLELGGRSSGLSPERHKLSPAVPELNLRPFFNESFRDFSREDQHAAFARAVAAARVPHVASDTTPDQAREMVARAKAAQPAWERVPWQKRCEVLLNAAAIMRRRRDELSALMIKEAAKTWREADADTCEAIDFCEYYARTAPRLFQRQRVGRFIGELDETLYQPRGVAVVIAPWNFPLAICAGMTVAALVTGNTVIVKPAEQTPAIAKVMVDILNEALKTHAGSDPSLSAHRSALVQFCPAPGETTGAALVRDPRVALIAFTGSRDVGLDIAHAAAPPSPFASSPPSPSAFSFSHLKHVICEMGGKNAIIIDTSADPDEAVLAVRHSAFGFQGQKCSACSRLIVVDPAGPAGPAITRFRDRLIEATKALTVGDPALPGTDVGPVIDDAAAAKIRAFIDRARASGLNVAQIDPPTHLSTLPGGAHRYIPPTIVWNVPESHELAREEVFGPVLAVMHAPSFDEALRLANDLPYKLTGGVFSRKPSHLERAKREFKVGNLYLNRGITGALVARQPFGGFGASGGGTKAGGEDYLLHFVEPRAICENTMRRGFAPEL